MKVFNNVNFNFGLNFKGLLKISKSYASSNFLSDLDYKSYSRAITSYNKKYISFGSHKINSNLTGSSVDKHKDEIIKMRNNGLSCRQIAKIIGTTHPTILFKLKSWGEDSSRLQSQIDKKLEDNKDIIFKMACDGKSQRKIAREFNCSSWTICYKLNSWIAEMLTEQPDLDEYIENCKENIVAMKNSGMSLQEISEGFGCAVPVIAYKIKLWSIAPIRKQGRVDKYLEDNKEYILQMRNHGKSQREIAKEFDCSQHAVCKKLNSWKV